MSSTNGVREGQRDTIPARPIPQTTETSFPSAIYIIQTIGSIVTFLRDTGILPNPLEWIEVTTEVIALAKEFFFSSSEEINPPSADIPNQDQNWTLDVKQVSYSEEHKIVHAEEFSYEKGIKYTIGLKGWFFRNTDNQIKRTSDSLIFKTSDQKVFIWDCENKQVSGVFSDPLTSGALCTTRSGLHHKEALPCFLSVDKEMSIICWMSHLKEDFVLVDDEAKSQFPSFTHLVYFYNSSGTLRFVKLPSLTVIQEYFELGSLQCDLLCHSPTNSQEMNLYIGTEEGKVLCFAFEKGVFIRKARKDLDTELEGLSALYMHEKNLIAVGKNGIFLDGSSYDLEKILLKEGEISISCLAEESETFFLASKQKVHTWQILHKEWSDVIEAKGDVVGMTYLYKFSRGMPDHLLCTLSTGGSIQFWNYHKCQLYCYSQMSFPSLKTSIEDKTYVTNRVTQVGNQLLFFNPSQGKAVLFSPDNNILYIS